MKNIKWSSVLTLLLIVALMTGGSALAFNDIKDTAGKEEIMLLKEKGIISGITDKTFAPQGKLTYAQGITLIVKGFNLNINAMLFAKMPVASDYFTKVPNNAWYAKSLLYAQLNGLTLPKDLDPNKLMSREEFTNFLVEAINTTGDYPMIMMYAVIKDEADVSKEYMNSIQQALITKLASVDKDQKFYPKREITRAEAAVMLAKGIEFVAMNKDNIITEPIIEFPDAEVSFTATAVTSAVYQVDVTWKQAPSPGHGIRVDRIEFQDKQALVFYSLHKPEEGRMHAQVLTDLKATTYVDVNYKIVLVQSLHPNGSVDPGISSPSSGAGIESADPSQSTGIINSDTGSSQSSDGSIGQ